MMGGVTEHPMELHRAFANADTALSRSPLVDFLEIADAQDAVSAYRSRLARALALRAGDVVLDVGCGPGTHAAALAAGHDGPVLGLDRGSMIEEAWASHPHAGVRWVVGDAADIPLAAGSVDAVFTERVLMYVEDPAAVVGEMLRVLRPGGRVVLFELDYAGMVLGGDPATADAVHGIVRASVPDDRTGRRVGSLLVETGAVDVEVVPFAMPIPPPLFDAAVARPGRAAVDAGHLPRPAFDAWLAQCRRPGSIHVVPGMLATARRGPA